ncbi:MAG: hypothetical protein NTZ46_05830, partial [Verrucomicrobia bacterium]|nr:hypothetical protein [Verrucomicrobiota bacterium]
MQSHPTLFSRTAPPPHRFQRGVALVIVLAFVVLMTGLVVAFFSRAESNRQVAHSSANETRGELFAQGALDTIIGDLKQEIVDGSDSPVAGVYIPKTAADAVPALVGSSGAGGLENLLKRSASGLAFSPASTLKRASSASTTGTSLDGRSISKIRWNKSLLLAKANPTTTDLTPVPGFTAPDWVLVARDGSNPTAWNANMVTSGSNPTTVLGRYAYAIYDEGGLLDMNVAGYPSVMTSAQLSAKNALAYADLTQLKGSDGNALLTSGPGGQIDALVGWRNYATTQASGTFPSLGFSIVSGSNYANLVLNNTQGFLTTGGTAVYNNQTDRMFTSRQQLISLLTQGIATNTTLASVQSALQYMGTFSRDLNQPSYAPDSTRPKIVSGDGGNDAYQGDDLINPSFLTVKVATPFTRNDGSETVVGEPLVKKRFALNRLAWLTYKGPSHDRGQNDPDIQALINKGIPWTYLQKGTAANIQAYFGLSWDNVNNRWRYNVHNWNTTAAMASGSSGAIATLSRVRDTNREPDFIELLKASINVGCLAKGATRHDAIPSLSIPAITGAVSWEHYQFKNDISTNYAIFQIAANIIDQFDTDGYPTYISVDMDDGLGDQEFTGVENLPYFYRTRVGTLMLKNPNPYPFTSGTNPALTGATSNSGTNTLVSTGFGVSFLQPEIWNPHDANSTLGTPRPGGGGNTDFRMIVESALPNHTNQITIGERSATRVGPGSPFVTNQRYYSDGAEVDPATLYSPEVIALSDSNTALNFSDANGTLFREPTLLIRPGLPSGSQLSIDASNALSQAPLVQPYLTLDPLGNSQSVKCLQPKATSSVPNRNYIGIYLGGAPIRWVANDPASGQKYVLSAIEIDCPVISAGLTVGDYPATYRLQYKDGTNWRTYDQKVTDILGGGNSFHYNTEDDGYGVIGPVTYAVCIDPRTSRFGMPGGFYMIYSGGTEIPPYTVGSTGNQDPTNYLDKQNTVITSQRLDSCAGSGLAARAVPANQISGRRVLGLPYVAGWYPGNWNTTKNVFRFGLFSQNDPNFNNNGLAYTGETDSLGSRAGTLDPSVQQQYYTDPDGVVRRAMGAYPSSVTGLPMATATSFTGIPAPAVTQSQ